MAERADRTERFFVDRGYVDSEALELGFAWLLACAADNGHSRAALVLPGVHNIGYLGDFLGTRAAQTLQTDGEAEVEGGELTVSVHSEARPPITLDDGPILAVWTCDRSLERLDAIGASAICAVAWRGDEIERWTGAWNPADLRAAVLK
jgi:hypothetical protein